MHHNTLGRTGLEVTRLDYGSMGLRGPWTWGVVSDVAAEAILNAVLDAGINLIDTTPDDGLAEEQIGRAIGSRRQSGPAGPCDRLSPDRWEATAILQKHQLRSLYRTNHCHETDTQSRRRYL